MIAARPAAHGYRGRVLPRALVLVLALAALPALAEEPKRTEVRLVTFDLAGAGVPRLDARVAKLGEELTRLKPDVVCLQGVWRVEDGAALLESLAGAKLVHGRHWSEGWSGSGLLVASRWPLKEVAFQPFSLAGKPHKPWHGDWYARKGVALVALTTPAGAVQLANLHLHAGHGTEEYLPVQTAQAREAAVLLGDHGVRPPGVAWEPARPPLLLAGALEVGREALPFRLLSAIAALEAPRDDLGSEWVLARPGGGVAVKLARMETVLDKPLDLADGQAPVPLAPGPGRLAVLELRPFGRDAAPPLRDSRPTFRQVATEAEEAMARARDDAHRWGSSDRAKAVVLLVFAAAFFALSRLVAKLKRKKLGCLVALLSMTFIHVATLYAYLGAVYQRQEQAAYEVARQRLEKALETAKATPPR